MEDGIRTAAGEYQEARDLIEHGRPELALPILARLSAFAPDDDEIREAWICAHLDLQRYPKVLEIADAAIAHGRPRPRFEFWKAVAYEHLNDPDRAEAYARAALAAEPSYTAAVLLLTLLLEKRNRNEEALELCRRAAAESPDNDELAERAIAIANGMELYGVVVESARDYLRRFGKNAAVLSHLGSAYLDVKEYRKADRAFRDAAALEPDVADHHFNVVMLAISTGNEAAADAYLDKLARRDPEMAGEVANAVDRFFEELEENPL